MGELIGNLIKALKRGQCFLSRISRLLNEPDRLMNEINQTTRIFDISKKLWDRYQIAVMQERPLLALFLPLLGRSQTRMGGSLSCNFQVFPDECFFIFDRRRNTLMTQRTQQTH